MITASRGRVLANLPSLAPHLPQLVQVSKLQGYSLVLCFCVFLSLEVPDFPLFKVPFQTDLAAKG